MKKKTVTHTTEKKLPINKKNGYVYFLLGIVLVLYFNTLFNQYAFDDLIYIKQNSYVQEGFNGIGKILTSDALESFSINYLHSSTTELTGGRYRPLSFVTFAIEHQIFGENPFVRHFVNVMLYLLTVFFLFRFLSKRIFPQSAKAAFFSALLFAVHPLHTEVVANVKGRDEILSLLFIILSLEYFFKYASSKKLTEQIFSWLFFFLALLSKEYALSFILLIPVLAYSVMKKNFNQSLVSAFPFWIVTFIYLFIRIRITGIHLGGSDVIINNPYLLADVQQQWASKIFALLFYIRLLLWPYPLSSDYSYNTFPYHNFSDFTVWFSLLIYFSIVAIAFYWLKKKNLLAAGLFFFLLPLFLVSNFVIDIGATVGERLIYHSSVGFSIISGWACVLLIKKIPVNEKERDKIFYVLSAVVVIASALIVIPRNSIWKDSHSLFTHDVKVVPNSVLMNNAAVIELMDEADTTKNPEKKTQLLKQSITYINHALSIYPDWDNLQIHHGNAYFKMGLLDSAAAIWQKASIAFPHHPVLKSNLEILSVHYYNQAMEVGKKGDVDDAIKSMNHAIEIDSANALFWFNLGGIYYMKKDFVNAKYAWEKTLSIDTNYNAAKEGLKAINN